MAKSSHDLADNQRYHAIPNPAALHTYGYLRGQGATILSKSYIMYFRSSDDGKR